MESTKYVTQWSINLGLPLLILKNELSKGYNPSLNLDQPVI